VAAEGHSLTPNNHLLFALENTEIVYQVVTSDGPPQLRVEGFFEGTFSGDEIRTADTELGTEVTVILVADPDGDSTVLTVLIPPVRVEPGAVETRVETVAFVTTKHSSFGGPPPGPEFSYELLELTGQARVIEF
jgi:hypothetical protein